MPQVKRPNAELLLQNPTLKCRIEISGVHNDTCSDLLSNVRLSKDLAAWVGEMLDINPDPHRVLRLFDDPDLCGDSVRRPPTAWFEKGTKLSASCG